MRRNGALFGATVRLDGLVVTAGSASDPPVVAPTTYRFPKIRDDDMLPLDNVLLYHGPGA